MAHATLGIARSACHGWSARFRPSFQRKLESIACAGRGDS